MENSGLFKINTRVKEGFQNSKIHKYLMGFIASTLHSIIILILIFVAIFSFNIKTLTVTFVACLVIIMSNLFIHNCPLTIVEEEAWGDSVINFLNQLFPINYDRNRKYEVQL